MAQRPHQRNQTSGWFAASRARAIRLFDELELSADYNPRPDYASLPASELRYLSYVDLWRRCIGASIYDIRLENESLVQFRQSEAGETYCFIDCPLTPMSFEQFALESLGQDWSPEAIEILSVELWESFEDYKSSLDAERPATPCRYDYSPDQYKTPCHPAGHLHFGFASEVRVATRRRWTPESFALFVVRQYFPGRWADLMTNSGRDALRNAIRDSLDLIEPPHWGDDHETEIYLY